MESRNRTDATMYLPPSSCRSGSTRKCRGWTPEPWACAEGGAALPAMRAMISLRLSAPRSCQGQQGKPNVHASACRCGERNGETHLTGLLCRGPTSLTTYCAAWRELEFTEGLASVKKLGKASLIPHIPLHAENLLHFTDTSSLCLRL